MKRTILKTVSLPAIITALAPMLNAHLLEVGPVGYDTWQITGDSGAASTTRDQAHAVGRPARFDLPPVGLVGQPPRLL